MDKERKIKPEKRSEAAKIAAKPGVLAQQGKEKRPFLHRAKPTKRAPKRLGKLVGAALDLQKDECLRLAGVALTTMDILLGKGPADRQVARERLRNKRPVDKLQDAQAMVHRLLSFLQEKAPEALTAQILLEEDGKLRVQHNEAQAKREEKRRRLHGEDQAVLYPSSAVYSPEGIIRLYK